MHSAASDVTGLMLEEVEVFAQKRAESIQDVPISITVLSGEKITDFGIKDLAELSSLVPNLFISEGVVNTNIFMRGVGSGLNRSFEQSVGMFIDGIYLGRGRQYRAPFMDLERVEVLRGPQGVLFGKNTIAGTLNLVTAKPKLGQALNGHVVIDVGDYGEKTLLGIISASVNDRMALRFSLKNSGSDGYVENTKREKDEPAKDEQVFRLTFNWQPAEHLLVSGKMQHDDFESRGVSAQIIDFDRIITVSSGLEMISISSGIIEDAVKVADPAVVGANGQFIDKIDNQRSAMEKLRQHHESN